MGNTNKRYPEPREYVPINQSKYVGKRPIILRSSWEFHFANIIDRHPSVIQWASESIVIPYWNPVKNCKSRYFPDFVVEFINRDGNHVVEIIEIKPEQDGKVGKSKRAKNKLFEDSRFVVNQAKWTAAKEYCDKYGFTFKVLTEKELFGKSI